ncbi:MAG: hypothetical protein LBN20_00675 [Endomicrobium sp.]|jgi:probable addiction module antidote protein|nr:hypothetical protein [Endomicrobium sp.]
MKKESLVNAADVFEKYADKIKGNPKALREFESAVNTAYNSTGDIDVLLTALKVIAIAKGNFSQLARDANIERKSIYNMFKKGSNPTMYNVNAVANNLEVKINLSFAQTRV